MKKRNHFSISPVGGSSLLAIFAVLCLTVFALLSLSTVQAERRQADAATASVVAYYDADLRAQEIYALLRSGSSVEGVREECGIYAYEVPISQRQILRVRLEKQGDDWSVLSWVAVPVETEPDDSLDVWKGTEEES